jgi:hypothetical protein
MQIFITRSGGKEHVFGPCLSTSADKVLPRQILHGHAMSSILRRQAPENHNAPCACHKDPWGPLGEQTDSKCYTHLEYTKGPHICQLEEEVDQLGPQGFGKTDLGSTDPGLPRGGI